MSNAPRNYTNAFNCARCPGNNGPDGCPAWHELIEENKGTGEVRVIKDCGLQLWTRVGVEIIRAANGMAAEAGILRAELTKALNERKQIVGPGLAGGGGLLGIIED